MGRVMFKGAAPRSAAFKPSRLFSEERGGRGFHLGSWSIRCYSQILRRWQDWLGDLAQGRVRSDALQVDFSSWRLAIQVPTCPACWRPYVPLWNLHHEERTPTCFSEVLLWWSWSRGTRSANLSPSTGPSEEVDESSTSWQVHGQVLPKKCTCLSAQLWGLSCCWKKSAGHEKGCPPPHCYRLCFNFILWTKQNKMKQKGVRFLK